MEYTRGTWRTWSALKEDLYFPSACASPMPGTYPSPLPKNKSISFMAHFRDDTLLALSFFTLERPAFGCLYVLQESA